MSLDPRSALSALILAHREDYASLSRMLGRNPAYIQQFLHRGTPRVLAERDRRRLADYFGVPEAVLGGPPAPPAAATVAVPLLAVGASAGSGSETGIERESARIAFPGAMLRRLAAAGPELLSMIHVEGRSMEPTLADGDAILVDRGDGADRLRDGIYVLRLEDRLMVKRIARGPAKGVVAVVSDNGDFPSWPDVALASLAVIGRVVWAGGRVG